MIIDEAHEPEIEEENYFISMTDMMVGLIFIFIILLMYYALQFHRVTDQLSGANQTRTQILQKLQASLKQKGVDVQIDTQNGILRLPDAILFDSGRSELKPAGVVAVKKLSEAMEEVLPCYVDSSAPPGACPSDAHKIESLYVEGHTDTDAFSGGGLIQDNWDLSVVRATNTYRAIAGDSPELTVWCSQKAGKCNPILSVSGYGAQRPAEEGNSAEIKARNRRIDLRIIMITPDSSEVDALSNQIGAK